MFQIRAVRRAAREDSGQASRAREPRELAWTAILLLAGAMGFLAWTRSLDISLLVYYGTIFYFVGFAVLLGIVRDRGRSFMVGPALSFMGMGLLAPFLGLTGLLWGSFYVAFGCSSALPIYLRLRDRDSTD